jgi:CheY-like chemotaxis protein
VQQIVDDDALFVKVAQTLLEPDGVTVAGVASTCAEAVERVGALRPDVVLIDIRLSEESGLEIRRRARPPVPNARSRMGAAVSIQFTPRPSA